MKDFIEQISSEIVVSSKKYNNIFVLTNSIDTTSLKIIRNSISEEVGAKLLLPISKPRSLSSHKSSQSWKECCKNGYKYGSIRFVKTQTDVCKWECYLQESTNVDLILKVSQDLMTGQPIITRRPIKNDNIQLSD